MNRTFNASCRIANRCRSCGPDEAGDGVWTCAAPRRAPSARPVSLKACFVCLPGPWSASCFLFRGARFRSEKMGQIVGNRPYRCSVSTSGARKIRRGERLARFAACLSRGQRKMAHERSFRFVSPPRRLSLFRASGLSLRALGLGARLSAAHLAWLSDQNTLRVEEARDRRWAVSGAGVSMN